MYQILFLYNYIWSWSVAFFHLFVINKTPHYKLRCVSSRENKRTETDSKGVGRDMLCSRKHVHEKSLALEAVG